MLCQEVRYISPSYAFIPMGQQFPLTISYSGYVMVLSFASLFTKLTGENRLDFYYDIFHFDKVQLFMLINLKYLNSSQPPINYFNSQPKTTPTCTIKDNYLATLVK
eukprot:TRINITY_DN10196_c0_g1_i2.p1 TRINITY_DN10196_c0_g1~~TRINITY_DN10196_c0_g1_i2.p1  ORF type:complete len:106 (+),score=1.88 TRINITY_DN10196_c0_g1_i2:3-320(+)